MHPFFSFGGCDNNYVHLKGGYLGIGFIGSNSLDNIGACISSDVGVQGL